MKRSVFCVLGVMLLSAGLALAEGTTKHPTKSSAKTAHAKRTSNKVRNITVVAIEGKITPSVIRVRRGDLVRLTFKAKDGKYGIRIPAFNVKGTAKPNRPVHVQFAATSKGEYEMRCTKVWSFKHWSENGKIIVE